MLNDIIGFMFKNTHLEYNMFFVHFVVLLIRKTFGDPLLTMHGSCLSGPGVASSVHGFCPECDGAGSMGELRESRRSYTQLRGKDMMHMFRTCCCHVL